MVKKNGHMRGKQWYKCRLCSTRFFGKQKSPQVDLRAVLWNEFVWERRTIRKLVLDYARSERYVRMQLEAYKPTVTPVEPCAAVFVADVTFFRREYGFLVYRIPELQRNPYAKKVYSETIARYRDGRIDLEAAGFIFLAIVLDGRPGIRALFADIPVQMCHFHQKQIITRYLTHSPKLEAAIQLKAIAGTLTYSTERKLGNDLVAWYATWELFLKEKTSVEGSRHWHYTHRRIRAAYRSLITNLPFLFTYQKYPELHIPTTTNSLDGTFSHLKDLTAVHRGASQKLKEKMIIEILGK